MAIKLNLDTGKSMPEVLKSLEAFVVEMIPDMPKAKAKASDFFEIMYPDAQRLTGRLKGDRAADLALIEDATMKAVMLVYQDELGILSLEPPRILRRLQLLRRWSHEQVEEVLT